MKRAFTVLVAVCAALWLAAAALWLTFYPTPSPIPLLLRLVINAACAALFAEAYIFRLKHDD